jgi:periplasmic divalent cation tolerance protein
VKPAVVVLMTTPTARDARRLADVLVTERLAACVHIQGRGRSVYRWKGRIERVAEQFLIAKTTRARLPALIRRVHALHSYSVPEIVALPIQSGNPAYLAWLAESVA